MHKKVFNYWFMVLTLAIDVVAEKATALVRGKF
jgi:hypothetical protein